MRVENDKIRCMKLFWNQLFISNRYNMKLEQKAKKNW